MGKDEKIPLSVFLFCSKITSLKCRRSCAEANFRNGLAEFDSFYRIWNLYPKDNPKIPDISSGITV